MKAHELGKKLLSGENVSVMFQDPNSKYGPFSAEHADLKVTKEDEFPEDFNMPEGFKYILLTN
jgi:hypothetical protein